MQLGLGCLLASVSLFAEGTWSFIVTLIGGALIVAAAFRLLAR